jgi:subtilase family serine protease
LQIVHPDGQSSTDPFSTDWPLETSLDVEWAHAVAPDAKIVIVEAPSDDSTELTYALHYAVTHKLGNIISNSYGYPEYAYGTVVAQAFNTIIREAAAQGIAVNVSTGDSGDFGLGTPFGAASIPADSPYATAIGGTSLNVPSDIGPVDSAWGTTVTYLASVEGVSNPPNIQGFQEGSGGGESDIFALPKWEKQAGLVGAGRQLPDISAIADPQTGGIIVAPNYNGTASVFTVIGGTSLASPVFSGIWALAQQAAGAKLGQAAPIIAAMQGDAVTDIVPVQASNSNLFGTVTHAGTTLSYGPADLLGIASLQTTGFVGVSAVYLLSSAYDISFGADSSLMAAPGWDTATGWGSPNGMSFIRAAVAATH